MGSHLDETGREAAAELVCEAGYYLPPSLRAELNILMLDLIYRASDCVEPCCIRRREEREAGEDYQALVRVVYYARTGVRI